MLVYEVKIKINNILCIGFKDSKVIKIYIFKIFQRGDNWWELFWYGIFFFVNIVIVFDKGGIVRDIFF